jgi:hypothetical protein
MKRVNVLANLLLHVQYEFNIGNNHFIPIDFSIRNHNHIALHHVRLHNLITIHRVVK